MRQYIVKIKKLFPGLVKIVSNYYQYNSFNTRCANFNEASKVAKSYDSKKFSYEIEKTYKKSISNSSTFDRDGQLILKKNINFKLINYINTLTKSKNKKYIIDFGGSLNNFYRINKNYLNYNISWIVFDKKVTVDVAKKYFKPSKFFFFHSTKSLHKFIMSRNIKVEAFLFGSVLQYLDEIEKVLKLVKELKCKNIIIDRQPMLKAGKTTYNIQKVPFWHGRKSFAVKLYNYRNFISIFNKHNFFLVDSFKGLGNDFKNGKYFSQVYRKY